MSIRVWLRDEFDGADEDERHDRAWVADGRDVFGMEPSAGWVRDAAEAFAEHFHNRRDGWECSWPIEFVVHDGTSYFVVEVDRETVPEFHACKPRPLEVAA